MKFTRLFWEIVTPLGAPVEPDVNMMYAGSDPSIGHSALTGRSETPSSNVAMAAASPPIAGTSIASVPTEVSTNASAGRHRSIIVCVLGRGLAGSTTKYGTPNFIQ